MEPRSKAASAAEKPSRKPPPGGGRPLSQAGRNVPQAIIQAAEICLRDKSPQEIHIKEIAALAGVQTSMIHYYFGSKYGLLIEIVRRSLDEVREGFRDIGKAIRDNELADPTRAMIAQFVAAYKQHPASGRILVSEVLLENSPVRDFFIGHWDAQGKTMLADAIRQLSALGYYRRDVNIDDISTMIRSTIFFPLLMRPSLVPGEGNPPEHYLDDAWIDFVSSVFDRYLRP